ncbi:hypothetical protein [Oceanobacillus picturae]|uniref:hypothetical protein n=1 Tax=Oceanobacillus picturae TaxID=171693 RepID=UPI0036450D82
MELKGEVLVNLKNQVAHNIAQKIVQGNKDEVDQYLKELQLMLQNLQVLEDVVKEIVLYARLKGRSEARILKSMYKKFEIKGKVTGHGGSSISPHILAQQISLKEIE